MTRRVHLGTATGARTFQSAAAPAIDRGFLRFQTVMLSQVAADWKVRAPAAMLVSRCTLACRALILALAVALLALAQTSLAQRASNWRVYKMADGLPESACLSVTVAPQGKVFAKHLTAPSVTELDGYGLTLLPAPAAPAGRIYGSPGGQLWSVVPEGLLEFNQETWDLVPVAEIAAAFRAGLARSLDPVALCPVRQGVVILVLPDRLLELNSEAPASARVRVLLLVGQTKLEKFCGLTLPITREGGLWLSGARGFIKLPGPVRNLKAESNWQEYLAPAALGIENLFGPQDDGEGGVVAVAEASASRQKVIVHLDGQQRWTTQPAGSEKIRHAWRIPDQTGWAATIDSLFQWETDRPGLVETEEISARQYFDVAVEPGGVFWLATSEGLFRYAPLCWRTPRPLRQLNSLIHALTGDQEGRLWCVSAGGLHNCQDERRQDYPFPAATARILQSARAIFALQEGTLALEAEGQLFRFHPATGTFEAVMLGHPSRRLRAIGLLKDARLCVQSFNPADPESDDRLEICDGRKFEPPSDPLAGCPLSKTVSALFQAQNGDWWLSGDGGTAWYHDKKWRTFASTDQSTPESALGFAEPADGRIWCATPDKIWEFDGRNWSILRRGFDRIYAILRTRDTSLWVASNSGLHRFFQGAWLENGIEEGLPTMAVRQIYEDQRGRLWAGTTRGLSRYYPEADADPPQPYIQKLSDQERSVPEGGILNLTFSGQDKWKFTPRERLLYSYRLDEREWSPFQEANSVPFADLPPGKHYFQVRAMDRNGNVDLMKAAKLDFAVVLPWYKETRLVLISTAGVAAALFFAGLAFNRHRQLLHSYAEVEGKVAQRSNELELANRELLHSQKMNALGTLAAGIAHDFNNILSIIKGSAQIIEDNLDNPQKVRTRVERIKTVVEQGAGIVKAMLGFSRNSEDQPGTCDLNGVVDDTLKLLGDRFLREVQVRFDPAPALPQISCSKDFIQQILLNFIFNAAESYAPAPERGQPCPPPHTERGLSSPQQPGSTESSPEPAPPGNATAAADANARPSAKEQAASAANHKQVIVATRQMGQLPPAMVVMPAKAPGWVCISVRDFGCGIAPENLARVFEPFFTTKALSARRGTGLGLSMVYELARKLEAGLAVESVLNQGSIFTLILPVRDVVKSETDPKQER